MTDSIRYKKVNGKKRPLCDFGGRCKNLAFKEVYFNLGKKTHRWSYLCRKHFEQENKKSGGKLVCCKIN
jgi:hypothetical protein